MSSADDGIPNYIVESFEAVLLIYLPQKKSSIDRGMALLISMKRK